MNIVEQFGGRKNNKVRVDPTLPAPVIEERQPVALHPAAQEAAVLYSEALERAEGLRHELDTAREQFRQELSILRGDLEIERRHISNLQQLLEVERAQKEQYMRYSVEIRTHLGHVAQAAIQANDIAMKIAVEGVDRAAERITDEAKGIDVDLDAVEQAITGKAKDG